MISEPTPVTSTTSTLIDLIFTTFLERIKQSGVFSLTTSAHCATFCVSSYKKDKVPSKLITYRSFKDVNWVDIGLYISKINWDGVNASKSSDANLESFENVVTFALDQFFPEKKKRIKGKSPCWMTNEILSLISERNSLKSEYESNPSPDLLKKYRKLRNYVACRVSKERKNYYFQNFDKIDDSASIWKTYYKLSGRDIKRSADISFLKINDSLESDSLKKSQALAESFVVPDLTPPEVRDSLLQSVKHQAIDEDDSFNCTALVDELAKFSSRMKWKSSPSDFIPTAALKDLLPHILIPLSILFSCFFCVRVNPN